MPQLTHLLLPDIRFSMCTFIGAAYCGISCIGLQHTGTTKADIYSSASDDAFYLAMSV